MAYSVRYSYSGFTLLSWPAQRYRRISIKGSGGRLSAWINFAPRNPQLCNLTWRNNLVSMFSGPECCSTGLYYIVDSDVGASRRRCCQKHTVRDRLGYEETRVASFSAEGSSRRPDCPAVPCPFYPPSPLVEAGLCSNCYNALEGLLKIICTQNPIYRRERNIGYAMEDAYMPAPCYVH